MDWLKKILGTDNPKIRPASPGGFDPKKIERVNAINDKLLADRIIFLGTPINDENAQLIVAQLLYLEDRAPRKDISFYIDSSGGSVAAAMAIYDTMKSIRPDVATVCVGQAGGMAAILAGGGRKGKRFSTAAGRFVFFRPRFGGDDALISAAERQRRRAEIKKLKRLIVEIFVRETGRPAKKILSLMINDTLLTAAEAVELGLVDDIVADKR
ncbi:MAG: ATP-dependent Clp protease proteolytic subunit [Acidobacteria bacterium]|nr:ATP-dependent Clp protease proteolytic subunit [Acidobacteriota bacterium]